MKHFFVFKKLTFIIIAIFFHTSAFSQHRQKHPVVLPQTEEGSLDYLSACDGFKQIKLGADVKYLDLHKLTYLDGVDSLDTDSCYKYAYQDDTMLDMGDGLFLNLVGLRTYKNKIVNIYLFFPRDAGYDVLQKFKAEFGKFTNAPGDFMYDWKINGVTLSLRYEHPIDMGVAIFTCDNIARQVAQDDRKRNALKEQAKDLLGAL